MTGWEVAVRVAVYVAAAGGIVFPLLYGLGSPWWRTQAGRTLMTLGVSMAAVFVLVVLSYTIGPYPGQMLVRVVVYSGLAAALWRLNFVVLRAQRTDRRARRSQRAHRTP